jgi:hypothetical protein
MSRSCVLEVFVTNEMNAMVILNLKFNNGKAMDTKTYNTVLNRHTLGSHYTLPSIVMGPAVGTTDSILDI